MSAAAAPTALRVDPMALDNAAAGFATLAATVRTAQAQLATVVAACVPLLSDQIRDAAQATGRGADQALDILAGNYATLGSTMADLATSYRQLDQRAVRR